MHDGRTTTSRLILHGVLTLVAVLLAAWSIALSPSQQSITLGSCIIVGALLFFAVHLSIWRRQEAHLPGHSRDDGPAAR